MKKHMTKLAGFTMVGAMLAFGQAASAEDALVLTYAEVNTADSLDGQIANFFKEKVDELSEGSIVIDIQAGGVLGSEDDILSTMTIGGGTVDLCRISMSALTNYGGQKSQLVSVPYTFVDREHFWKYTESEVGQEILNEAEELGLGVKGLYYQEEGFRNFFFIDDISSIEQLENLKIRVNSDPMMANIVEALGANATVISSGEMYSALQQGTVDGADQPTTLYESGAFYEVAPYLIEDGHILSVSEVVVADSKWAELTDEQKAVLEEAGAATSEYCKSLSEDVEEESKTRLTEAGVTIYPVEDKQPWIDMCQDLINESVGDFADTYEKIVALK